MKKKRFAVEQIVAVLKEAEAGMPVAELIRRIGVTEQTFYRWKKLYGGLGIGQLRRLKQLKDEDRKLMWTSLDFGSTALCADQAAMSTRRRRGSCRRRIAGCCWKICWCGTSLYRNQ